MGNAPVRADHAHAAERALAHYGLALDGNDFAALVIAIRRRNPARVKPMAFQGWSGREVLLVRVRGTWLVAVWQAVPGVLVTFLPLTVQIDESGQVYQDELREVQRG